MSHHFDPSDIPASALTGALDLSGIVNGQGLVWDAGSELFVPADVGGGTGAGDLTLIDVQTLASDAAQIDFTSIPGTYGELVITGRLRSARAGQVGDGLHVRVGNGSFDTGSNYVYGTTQTYSTNAQSASSSATAAEMDTFGIAAATATAGVFSLIELSLPFYADTDQYRHMLYRSVLIGDGTTGNARSFAGSGAWKNTTSAIDRVRIYSRNGANWLAGSKLRLYGYQ